MISFWAFILSATLGSVGDFADTSQASSATVCQPAGTLKTLPPLPEASGLAIGTAGRLWMHNDSGAPELIAVEPTGAVAGRLTLSGARVDDWEALAAGPCGGSGSCLFVGDIGDNEASRKQITVYRLPQPANASGSARAEAINAVYPDGRHDAETLLVAPDGTLFIVTKGDTGPIGVYRFPRTAPGGATVTLEKVGKPLVDRPRADQRVTDGAFSSDGKWVVLRTHSALTFYRGDDFINGDFREVHRVDVSMMREPQGEAVAMGRGNTVYIGGEGGGKKQPGTLATLSCGL